MDKLIEKIGGSKGTGGQDGAGQSGTGMGVTAPTGTDPAGDGTAAPTAPAQGGSDSMGAGEQSKGRDKPVPATGDQPATGGQTNAGQAPASPGDTGHVQITDPMTRSATIIGGRPASPTLSKIGPPAASSSSSTAATPKPGLGGVLGTIRAANPVVTVGQNLRSILPSTFAVGKVQVPVRPISSIPPGMGVRPGTGSAPVGSPAATTRSAPVRGIMPILGTAGGTNPALAPAASTGRASIRSVITGATPAAPASASTNAVRTVRPIQPVGALSSPAGSKSETSDAGSTEARKAESETSDLNKDAKGKNKSKAPKTSSKATTARRTDHAGRSSGGHHR